LDPCVYDVFDSESDLELKPEVVTLTPGTPCIKDTYEPTVFMKYTLSGCYATMVLEASVAYSCRQQQEPIWRICQN